MDILEHKGERGRELLRRLSGSDSERQEALGELEFNAALRDARLVEEKDGGRGRKGPHSDRCSTQELRPL